MAKTTKWIMTKAQQKAYSEALTRELVFFRAKLGITQAELSNAIGISRQTYSAVENGYRDMSWNTYLSLICFFDHNAATRKMLRETKVYPTELFSRYNDGKEEVSVSENAIAGIPSSITDRLDDTAFHTIRTVVMMEYARCAELTSEQVMQTFEDITTAAHSSSRKLRW